MSDSELLALTEAIQKYVNAKSILNSVLEEGFMEAGCDSDYCKVLAFNFIAPSLSKPVLKAFLSLIQEF